MKDLFISHASEDKDDLVRPLAEQLKRAGVDVWYDEYTVLPGDSITESLDKGMIECEYGLVVISPAYLQKKWTEYELKSLLTKDVNKGKTIIPVWHNVDYETVSKRSLYLADKKAINSSDGIGHLVFEIIRTVRPDIISHFSLKAAMRELKKTAKEEMHFSSDLKEGEIIHKALPSHMVYASKIVVSAFPGVIKYSTLLQTFMRDYVYDDEFMIWCVITSAYLDTIYTFGKLPNQSEMKDYLSFLVALSLGNEESGEKSQLPIEIKKRLAEAYFQNASVLFPLSKGRGDK